MVTPKKGVFDALPLNAEGRKVGDSWDPARDEAAGEQCRAYGAAQHHAAARAAAHHVGGCHHAARSKPTPARRRACFVSAPRRPAGEPTWQGQFGRRSGKSRPGGRGAGRAGGNLKVVTTNLRPGYVRKNGAPYSDKAVVTEYYDVNTAAERRSVDDGHDQGRGSACISPGPT